MPHFGNYKEKISEIKQKHYKNADILEQKETTDKNLIVINSDKVMKLKDVIGRALDKIGAYNQLNNKEQVVALIDEVKFNR